MNDEWPEINVFDVVSASEATALWRSTKCIITVIIIIIS